jgi:phage baseplate assembly protein W
MNAGQLYGKGISFPPRLGEDGRWAWSEGEQNVRDNIQVILLTDQGERVMLPDFGGDLDRFLFEPNTTATRHRIASQITQTLEAWEPRVAVEAVDVVEDPHDPQAAIATLSYRLVASQGSRQVSLRVTLAG